MESAITDGGGRATTALNLGDQAREVQVQAKIFGQSAAVSFTALARNKVDLTVDLGDVVISAAAVKVGGDDSPFVYRALSGNRVTFAVGGQAPKVQVGDIMVNTVEPYFLKKVVQVVQQSGSELVVETRPAALTEVVKKAVVREHFSIPDSVRQKLAVPHRIQGPSITFDNTTIAADAKVSLKVTSG